MSVRNFLIYLKMYQLDYPLVPCLSITYFFFNKKIIFKNCSHVFKIKNISSIGPVKNGLQLVYIACTQAGQSV